MEPGQDDGNYYRTSSSANGLPLLDLGRDDLTPHVPDLVDRLTRKIRRDQIPVRLGGLQRALISALSITVPAASSEAARQAATNSTSIARTSTHVKNLISHDLLHVRGPAGTSDAPVAAGENGVAEGLAPSILALCGALEC
jgi:hypothetical protein